MWVSKVKAYSFIEANNITWSHLFSYAKQLVWRYFVIVTQKISLLKRERWLKVLSQGTYSESGAKNYEVSVFVILDSGEIVE
jgi:hypothetical protein